MEPTDQAKMADSFSGSTQSLIIVVIALKMYMTAMPAMIIVVGDAPFIFETSRMTPIGMREKRNAPTTIEYAPLTTETPSPITSVAPKPAPDDMPVVYGSAKGLRRMLCITAPAAPSPAPARSPVHMRGSLQPQMR